jgi:hypothetical protein
MPDYFHGTKQPFANTIVGGAVNVAKGSGEFGVGFYTQQRVTDAWHWAYGRWKKKEDEPAVVVVSIAAADFSALKIKGPLDHNKSDELRRSAEKAGKSKYVAGVDVVVGTIKDRPAKRQEKFESDRAQVLLNSSKVKRSLHDGT